MKCVTQSREMFGQMPRHKQSRCLAVRHSGAMLNIPRHIYNRPNAEQIRHVLSKSLSVEILSTGWRYKSWRWECCTKSVNPKEFMFTLQMLDLIRNCEISSAFSNYVYSLNLNEWNYFERWLNCILYFIFGISFSYGSAVFE